MKLRPGLLTRHTVGGGGAGTPTYFAVSNFAAAAQFGNAILTFPASMTENDLMLLLVENPGSDSAIPPPAGGWAHVSGSPIADTGGAAIDNTRLHVFWKRVDSTGTQASINATASFLDHLSAIAIVVRNVRTVGNPWDISASGIGTGAQVGGLTLPGVTTTLANCLVVNCVATSADVLSTAEFSAWTNASLVSPTERVDNVSNVGGGTGFGAATGLKSVAGAVSATTVTCATSSRHAYLTVALAPS